MNTQEMIAIKAQYQTDIRRFALPATSTFATLQTSLNNLFHLSGPVIKFTDDEGDLCSITCQQELECALDLNQGKVLRLQLFQRVIEVPQIPVCAPTVAAQQFNKDQIKTFWHEKMENKKSCLVAKRERITAKLADESLSAERRRFLTSKLEQIQARISFLEAKQQQISQCPQENWKGQRGCFGKAQREFASCEPKCGEQDHKKLWIEKMQKRKAFLVAKRDQINAKLADESLPAERRSFLTAKLEKVNERLSFFEAKEQQFSQCPRGERRHGPCGRRGERDHAGHQGPKFGEGHDQRKKFWLEKMEDRKAWMIAKRDQINAKLADENLPAEKRRCLTEKLEKVNARIAFFDEKQQNFSQHPAHGERRHGPCGRGRVHLVVLEQHGAEKPCGGRAQKWGEWMEKKEGMLAAKKESINGKLASTELTPERRNALNAKLERIEERLKAIETRKQWMNDHQNGQDAGEHCRRGRGQGHRNEHPRCGRGGKRFELIKLQ